MRILAIFLFILFAAQLPQEPAAAQDSQTEAQALMQRAEAGDSVAQNDLGIMYALGRGVVQNYSEAAKWFRLAADQGNAAAQRNVAGYYAKGTGVPKDLTQAYMWYAIVNAPREMDRLKPHMTQQQIAEARRLADEWREAHKKS